MKAYLDILRHILARGEQREDLRARLRDEEKRRSTYQEVDAAARRFVARFRKEHPAERVAPEMRDLLDLIPE